MAKDPVCGARVQVPPPVPDVEHRGRVYGFCSEACRRRFVRYPDAYVERAHLEWREPHFAPAVPTHG